MTAQVPETQAPASEETTSPPVVTLWEEYGAGAEAIGRAVAEALSLPYHQQAFSSEEIESGDAAEATKIKDAETARTIERRFSLSSVLAAMGGAYGGADGKAYVDAQSERRELVEDNNATVRGYAAEGGVILGRNATVILRDRPHTLHVLLTGDSSGREMRAREQHGLSARDAERRRVHEDKVRADMSISLYGWDPREPRHYDLMIDTGRITQDAAVEAIVHVIRHLAH